MISCLRTRVLASILLLGAFLGQETSARAQQDNETLEWVAKITLRPLFGGNKSATRRWTHTPTISLLDASTEETKILDEVLEDLNGPIAKTPLKKLTFGKPNNTKAEIQVHFVLHEKMAALAKKLQFNNYEEQYPAFSISTSNQKSELDHAHVVLATDKLKDDTLRFQALAGLAGSIGLQNSSSIVQDSIFAGRGSKLWEMDQKLIVFFYNSVPPASDMPELTKAFKKDWPK